MKTVLVSLLLLTATARVALAQHESHCATPVATAVPEELLMRPVSVQSGLGQFHDPITTSSTEAQAFYNQGLAYLHGYVWIEAARAFKQALRHDSTLAMAYTGLSFAYSGLANQAGAKRMSEKASALAKNSSPREQTRIKVRLAQLAAMDSTANTGLQQTYKTALDKALAQFPEDAELWLLRGNAEEPIGSLGRGQMGTASSIAFYEAALSRVPLHPGAHHYLTHSYENIARFDKALYYGKRYADQAPQVPHAQHMYGHDLMKVGRLDEAIAYFSRTDSLERAYYASQSVEPWMDWHHSHNLTLLALCYQYQGQMLKVGSLLGEVAALKPFTPDFAFYCKKDYPPFLMRMGRWSEALAFCQPMTKAATAAERLVGHALAGRIYLQNGQLAKAQEALQAAEAQLPAVAKEYPALPGLLIWMTEPYVRFLKAALALSDPKSYQEGLSQMRAFGQQARSATTPDGWIEALFQLETIAQMALNTGDLAFAQEAAQRLYEHDPNYPGALFLVAQVAEKKKQKEEAKKWYAQAAKGWQKADPNFSGRTTAQKKGKS